MAFNISVNRKGLGKPPRMPKNAVIRPSAKVGGDKRKSRQVKLLGGPWHNLTISSKIEMGEDTLVLSIKGLTGFYHFSSGSATWNEVKNV